MKEGAGAILQVNPNAQETAVFDETTLDDFGEERDVDVAAADEDDGAAMAEVGFGLDNGGERGRSGTFGQGFFLLEEHEDGAGNLLVVDGYDFIDVAGDEREGDVASTANGDAVGDGGFSVDGDGSAGFARAEH